MCVRSLLAVGALGAVLLPATFDPPPPSYTVGQLKAVARSVHPTLESAEAGVAVAEATLRQARAHPNPAFTVAVGRGRPRDGGDSRSEIALELVQPIELPGVKKWRARLAEFGVRAAEVERVAAEWVVDSTVSRLAHTVLHEQRRADIARESARIAERLHAVLERGVELGESAPLEAVKARTEWFARRRNVLDAQGTVVAARSALNLFCGERLGEGYELADALEGAGPKDLPDDLVERLRSGNPILRLAEVGVDQADARILAERKQRFLRIELLAGHMTELDRTATSLGAGLTIPLWNRSRGAVAAATADRLRATADVRVLSLGLETELASATVDYERALAMVRLHREGWTAAAGQSLEISMFSFENGEASLLDVLDAQRAHLEVGLAEADSWAALNLARAEIERLIGAALETETHE